MPTLRCTNGHQWICLEDGRPQPCPECGATSGAGSDATIDSGSSASPAFSAVDAVTVEIPGAMTFAARDPEPTVAIPAGTNLADLQGKTVALPAGLTVADHSAAAGSDEGAGAIEQTVVL